MLRTAVMNASAEIALRLQVFPVTVVAPIDDAFRLAVEQRRLRCRNNIPCLSIDEYFSPSLIEMNVLRHGASFNSTGIVQSQSVGSVSLERRFRRCGSRSASILSQWFPIESMCFWLSGVKGVVIVDRARSHFWSSAGWGSFRGGQL